MNQNRKQMIILGVMIAGLVLVMGWQFGPFGGSATPAPATKTAAAAAVAQPAAPQLVDAEVDVNELLRGIKVVTFDYEISRAERNPMTPLVGIVRPNEDGVPLQAGTLLDVRRKRVTGIVFDPYSPMAVVDDEVVGVGHRFSDGIRVYAIERNRVVFQVGDTLVPVEMKEL